MLYLYIFMNIGQYLWIGHIRINANVSLTKKMHLNLSLYNWSVTIFESQEILPLDKNLLIFNQIEHLNESMCNIF